MEIPFRIDLKDKVAIVTGGGGVLGGVMAQALAECGAKVVIMNRTYDTAKKMADKINSSKGIAMAVSADVLSIESLNKAKEEIYSQFGTCDILINAAGGNHKQAATSKEYLFNEDFSDSCDNLTSFFDLQLDALKFVFDLNFLGTLLPTQIFAKDMVGKQDTCIINISSMSAYVPMTKVVAYSGAKAAINNFTQWLAVHMSKVGIRVNSIAPGFFLTTQNKSLLIDDNGHYTKRAEKIIAGTPAGRLGKPEELIGTLLWLVDTNAASFVNGIVVPVDGGFLAYSGV